MGRLTRRPKDGEDKKVAVKDSATEVAKEEVVALEKKLETAGQKVVQAVRDVTHAVVGKEENVGKKEQQEKQQEKKQEKKLEKQEKEAERERRVSAEHEGKAAVKKAEKEAAADQFPLPLQLDTLEGPLNLKSRLEQHLHTLEDLTLATLEEAARTLMLRPTTQLRKLGENINGLVEQLAYIRGCRLGAATFRMTVHLIGGYRSLLLHLYNGACDTLAVLRTKIGATVTLAHFTTYSLDDSKLLKLLEPRIYTFDLLREKMKLICALWKEVDAQRAEEKSAVDDLREEFKAVVEGPEKDGTVYVYTPFRKMDELCEENGVTPGKVYAKWHFGYQSKSYLCTFALCMKAIHVSVAESSEWTKASKILGTGATLAKMPGYIVDSNQVNIKYATLRDQGMPLPVLQGMWNLLESSTLAYLSKTMHTNETSNRWIIPTLNAVPIVLGTSLRLWIPTGFKKAPEDGGFPCHFLSWDHVSVKKKLVIPGQTVRTGLQGGLGAATKLTNKLRLSSSTDDGKDILVLHIHGGGFISQSPASHMVYLKEWAKQTHLPILSVDYSLSPDATFPKALNECFAVYKWLQDPSNCAKLGLSEHGVRIILAGDSAGGNLCLAVCVRAIEEESVEPPIGLLLHYPVAHLSLSASMSRLLYENDPVLNYQSMSLVASSYLGTNDEEVPFTNTHFSPAIVDDDIMRQFPPCYLAAGDIDPLLDDATFLFERFETLGVRSVLRFYRHLPHGYLNLPVLPGSHDASMDAAAFLKYLVILHKEQPENPKPFDVKVYRRRLDKLESEEKKASVSAPVLHTDASK